MGTFWDSTPWEVAQLILAAVERQRLEVDRLTATAWLTANWAAAAFFGKQPPLASVVRSAAPTSRRSDEPRQTREEQMAIIKALAAAAQLKKAAG